MTELSWSLDLFTEHRPMTTNKARTMHHQSYGKHIKAVREAWADHARNMQVPPFKRARFTVTPLHSTKASPQDVAACAPEFKAALDGLVDAGVLPDDSAEYVVAVEFLKPWVCGSNGLRIRITEVADEAGEAA